MITDSMSGLNAYFDRISKNMKSIYPRSDTFFEKGNINCDFLIPTERETAMIHYKCKKSNFTFNPEYVASVQLTSNKSVLVIYTSEIEERRQLLMFDFQDEAKEAYEEIADMLEGDE